jgi:hypothetical protein
MASSSLSGIRSPVSPRSGAASPRPSKFDADQLKTYIKKLLASTLQNVTWTEFRDKERGRALMKEVGDRVKERMLGALVSRTHRRMPGKLSHSQRSNREDCGWQISLINVAVFDTYPRSKYIVLTQVNENVGQGGR